MSEIKLIYYLYVQIPRNLLVHLLSDLYLIKL